MIFLFKGNKKPLLLVLIMASIVSFASLAKDLTQLDIQHMLIKEALKQDVEPALALAIAKVESDFNPTALSHAGAKGVMQIMPATAKNGFNVASHDLYQPQINIRVGVAYIKQLLEQYEGQVDIALSHYNGGSAVKRSNGALWIIPATRDYVSKVKHYAQQYQQEDYQQILAQATKSKYAKNKHQGHLSYAKQMAQDEESELENKAQLSFTSVQNITNQPANIQDIEDSGQRIDELQQLRVHNLTRILGPKKTKAMEDYTDKLVASQNAWNRGVNNIAAVRDAGQQVIQQSYVYGSKQQKVASWEAIFN
tara:strand:+ start:1653 stop:2579 length:927 start_codon:yes stop_codon:yes gene_type:complete